MKASCLICSLICLVFGAQPLLPGCAALAASTNGSVTNWYVSYGGTDSFTLLRSDPLNLPLSALRFERSYNDPTDLSHGYLDFNRDGKSDVFAAVLRPDGNYQWMYSAGGTSDWINLAYAGVPPEDLRFGDFNGDGYTDVFAALPLGNGLYQWVYSSKGTDSFQDLAYAGTPLADLRFGDFNGDGRTDVFTLQDAGGGFFDWLVSYGGVSNFTQIDSATTPLSQMLFADLNGDGHTDVFTTIPDTTEGYYDWLYSSGGNAAYQTEIITNLSYADVHPGQFNDDHRSDFFFTTPLGGGLYQWWYQYHTVSPVAFGSTKLAYASIPPDQLRFADFNGDGKTDVFVLVQQQSTNPTLMLQLNQTSVQPGQTLIATATLAPGDTSQAVDAYIVILLPTGQFFSLQLGGGLVPGIVPLAAGFTPFPVTQAVFAYTFTGTEPPGPYTFFTGLTVAGSSPLSLIGSIDEDTFTFSP